MPTLHAATLKPGDHPLRALERALAELPLAAAESAVLVFVAQFEEVYTLCSDPQERDAFVALLLQFDLTRIWEGLLAGKRAGATLRKIGGVGGALASNAKEIYGSLSESEQATARRALVRLVKLGEGTRDTRRRAPVDELCGRGQTAADVLVVLRKFAAENARLVTLSGSGAETLAEVTHEALFDHWTELRKWIDEGRVERRFYDRLAAATRLWNEDRGRSGRLGRPPDLDLVRAYAARRPEDLSTLDAEFLRASEEAQQAALAEKREAENRLSEAHERLQQQLLSTFVEQGRRLLVEAQGLPAALLWLHRAQSRGSRDAILPELLHDAMRCVDAVQLVLVGHRGRLLNARYNSTGCRIVKGHGASVWSATFSPDNCRILTASVDKTARIWDVSPETRTAEQIAEQIRRRLLVRFASEDSNVIIATTPASACG